MMCKRTDKSHEYAISDAAAAYIADALMELALQFEAKHFVANTPSLPIHDART
jgi:hypothetical protein